MTRVLCFYLPQFHPIPENDAWWGKGFTEWTNVARGKPLFRGHYQPHIPADLGYYDLRNEEVRIAQAELAALCGIAGFCYYHYWFNGKMLLERPFNEVLRSRRPEFPFCLCWANENWTRTWDGLDRQVLMEQNYERYDPERHIDWLDAAFADSRYVRVAGKPLFLVYRADDVPGIRAVIAAWREGAARKGYSGLYLCSVKNFKNRLTDDEAIGLGFDAVVDFQPNPRDFPVRPFANFARYIAPRVVNELILRLGAEGRVPLREVITIYDYRGLARRAMARPRGGSRSLPCVTPGWDNTPRKRVGATVLRDSDAETYRAWLEDALRRVRDYPEEERIVFVNAWNEWAEGCHLEPDLRHGRKFLEATKAAIGGTLDP